MLPWCEEHSTIADYSCQEGFICIYCKQREHAKHRFDTIETLSQQILTWVTNQETQIPNLDHQLQNINKLTETEIKKIRKNLMVAIERRKIKSMWKHLQFLKEEEEKMVSQFESFVSEHFNAYPKAKPTDFITNKPVFEIFLIRDDICEDVRKCCSGNVMQSKINLSEINKIHPLGEIRSLPNGILRLGNNQLTSSFTSTINECEVSNEVIGCLMKELEQLLHQGNYLDESYI